jgi:hypothetical protein
MFYSVVFFTISNYCLSAGSAHLVPIDKSLLGNTTERKKYVCVLVNSAFIQRYVGYLNLGLRT